MKWSSARRPQPLYTFVIPAYNEATRLPNGLEQLKSFVDGHKLSCEVLVVNDGSADDTADVVRAWTLAWPVVRLVERPHRGKGGATKAGIMAATGRYVALADADFAMPAAEFARFTPELLERYPLVIGTREGPGAQRFKEPAYRHVMGRVFNKFTQMALLPGIQDTQCGFKVLRRNVAQVLCQRQTIDGWGFDAELLVIARLNGCGIAEIPILWTHMPGSRINPLRDTVTMIRDILRIRRNRRLGLYTLDTDTPVVPADGTRETAQGQGQALSARPTPSRRIPSIRRRYIYYPSRDRERAAVRGRTIDAPLITPGSSKQARSSERWSQQRTQQLGSAVFIPPRSPTLGSSHRISPDTGKPRSTGERTQASATSPAIT